jgi:hypothetical protein
MTNSTNRFSKGFLDLKATSTWVDLSPVSTKIKAATHGISPSCTQHSTSSVHFFKGVIFLYPAKVTTTCYRASDVL